MRLIKLCMAYFDWSIAPLQGHEDVSYHTLKASDDFIEINNEENRENK